MTQFTDAARRLRTHSPSYPPLYTPFKVVSSWLTLALRDTRLSSNLLTVIWAMLLIAASVAVAHERVLPALGLVVVAILLDCLDGDLARARSQSSVSGTLLEQLAHWIGNMGLAVGAGAAIVLADPRPDHILLASTLAVVQSIYIAVVRQVHSEVANIPEHPRLRLAFRGLVKAVWVISPIELPMVVALVAFGVTEGSVLVLTGVLGVLSALVFVPHFILVRATDRRQWRTAPAEPEPVVAARRCADTVLARLPEAWWWTPGTPTLPPEVRALLSRPPMAAGAPVMASMWQELTELLPTLFRTSGRALPLACPEEVAAEAVITTFCRPADEILVVGDRTTAARWCAVAERLGVRAVRLEVAFGASPECATLESALFMHPTARLVCLPLSAADDGSRTDFAQLTGVLRDVSGLVVVDASLGLCADDLRMDEWGVDIAVSSSDSGIAGPPGISLVALGPGALAAADTSGSGAYLDLRTHLADGSRPLARLPAPALGGLYLSTRMVLAAGMDTVLAHRARMAERFRRGCAADVGLTPVAALPSAACTVTLLPDDLDLAELQQGLLAAQRMVIASGSTPDHATTLQFGHSGWLGTAEVDHAVEALAGHRHRARTTRT